MNRKWAAKKVLFGEPEMRPLHEAYWKRNDPVRVIAWEMDEEMTKVLVARCRKEKVTVNSALWNAFLAAQYDVQTDRLGHRKRSALAVNTRDKLNVAVGEVLGFYASSLTVKLPYSPKGTFWDAARKVHRTISGNLAKTNIFRMLTADKIHPTLLDALYFDKYGLYEFPLARKLLKKMGWHKTTYGYALTNVGRLNISAHYGSLELQSVYGPSFYSDVEEKMVGAVTACGKLTLMLACNEEALQAGTAERLREAAMAHLTGALKARQQPTPRQTKS